jgi:hypothetical protein
MLEDDGMEKLGFYSNSLISLGICGCSFFSAGIMNNLGPVQTMALGAVLTIPYLIALLLPAYKLETNDDNSILYSDWFINLSISVLSFVNGVGEALLWIG